KMLDSIRYRCRATGLLGRPAIRSRPITILAVCGIVLVAAIAVSAAMAAWHFRGRALSDRQRELQNLAATIAQHVDQQLQGVELVQKGVIDYAQSLGPTSGDDYRRQMSGRD